MKIQLENIKYDKSSSLHILDNPKLNDFYFWHFHPEYELVYIEADKGTRHVGDHTGKYYGSDLVMIGSNIPHLNFDYGIKTPYHKTVLHIKQDFLQEGVENTAELQLIKKLFDESKHGIVFYGETRALAGAMMRKLPHLSSFEKFIETLKILQILSTSIEKKLLHKEEVKNQHSAKVQDRYKKIYAYLDANYEKKIDIKTISDLCHMTPEAFCRHFKQTTRLTFTEFLNHYRINQAKHYLQMDKTVGEACYESGYESLSYFNRVFKKITGENPSSFRAKYYK
jgi:AraC-like DNA-binding protein